MISALVTTLPTNEVHRIEVRLSMLPGLQPQCLCHYAQYDCADSLVDSTTLLFRICYGPPGTCTLFLYVR